MTNLQLLKEYVKALPDTVPDGYDFNQEELEAANNLCAFLSDYAYDNEPTMAETMEWLLMEQESDYEIDDQDWCYECTGYGDDYSIDDDGNLISNCDDCIHNNFHIDEDD